VDLRELHEKEKQWGIRKLYLETRCDMLEKEIIEANVATRVDLRELHEKEKQWGIRKLYLETRCDMLEKEIIEANVATAHNYRHLVEYMKYTEFHKDKADRIS
jgi:hypothetical protein